VGGKVEAGAVLVTAVGEGGTAAQDARILPGDVITHIQGQPLGQPPIMADLISRIKGKPSSNVELRLERGWSVLSSGLSVSEAGVGASLPKVTTHPPTKRSLRGMESVSAGRSPSTWRHSKPKMNQATQLLQLVQ
jgi:hypothetical protein